MSGVYRSVVASSLLIVLVWATNATAAEHRLARRWSNSSTAVGVVQFGQNVLFFGKDGWSVGRLEPDMAGMLAVGTGRWTIDGKSAAADMTIGERDGRFYVAVAPKENGGSGEIKIMLRPVGAVPNPTPAKKI